MTMGLLRLGRELHTGFHIPPKAAYEQELWFALPSMQPTTSLIVHENLPGNCFTNAVVSVSAMI